jgi:annexin A7/11
MVFSEYQRQRGHSIEQAIQREMSSSVEKAFLTVAQFAKNPAAYYATKLHESMKGLGTRHNTTMIRTMVLRSEIDLQSVKREFQVMFGHSLEQFLKVLDSFSII